MKLRARSAAGDAIFAACYDDGSIVLYRELDEDNVDTRKRVIEEELCLNAAVMKRKSGRQASYVSYKGGAN